MTRPAYMGVLGRAPMYLLRQLNILNVLEK